nr:MAG TPA: hypothetical protein [Caudoviricetes sp.]
MSARQVKGISFSDEYMNEYLLLQRENNASQLICELLRDHYKHEDYNLRCVKRDLTHIKEILKDIMQTLEVKGYE